MRHKHSIAILLFLLFLLFIGSCLVDIYFCMDLNHRLAALQVRVQEHSIDVHLALRKLLAHSSGAEGQEAGAAAEGLNAINRDFAGIYRHLHHDVWLMVVLGIGGFALACRGFYLLESHLAKPLQQIKASLRDSLREDLPFKHITRQRSPLLNEIAELCNRMFDHWQRQQDEHFLRVNMLQKTALQLIEIPEKPTLVVTSGDELLLSNAAARDYLLGDAGERFLHYLTTAANQGDQEFDSHGRRFRLTRIDPAQVEARYCVVNVYQFEPQGMIQEEGPRL